MMNSMLTKSLVASLPVFALLYGSIQSFSKNRSFPALAQLVGASCLMLVIAAHVCEALSLFPYMRWGQEHSLGHYLDFAGAILGGIMFPTGYLLEKLSKQTANPVGRKLHRLKAFIPKCDPTSWRNN